MKRFLSLLAIVAVILSFSLVTLAFEDEATITLTSNLPATVEPGQTVNLEFYFDAGADLEVNGAFAGVRIYYPSELTLTGLADGGYGIFQNFPDKTDGDKKYIYFNGETEDTFVVKSSSVAMTATFTVPSDAANGTTYTFETIGKSNNLDDMNDGGMATIASATFTTTVKSGEEVFEPTYEGVKAADGSVTEGFAAGSKVATVFAKATGNLAAGEYGIVFGGHKYVGADDVLDGNYWVIRLYDPDGNILDFSKEYDCQIFVGETTTDADYQTATKN